MPPTAILLLGAGCLLIRDMFFPKRFVFKMIVQSVQVGGE